MQEGGVKGMHYIDQDLIPLEQEGVEGWTTLSLEDEHWFYVWGEDQPNG